MTYHSHTTEQPPRSQKAHQHINSTDQPLHHRASHVPYQAVGRSNNSRNATPHSRCPSVEQFTTRHSAARHFASSHVALPDTHAHRDRHTGAQRQAALRAPQQHFFLSSGVLSMSFSLTVTVLALGAGAFLGSAVAICLKISVTLVLDLAEVSRRKMLLSSA